MQLIKPKTHVTTYILSMWHFFLDNIINGKTYFKGQKGTSIDVLLTNKPRSFHKMSIFETGISDHHKMILSVCHSYFTHIPPKTMKYRNYKNAFSPWLWSRTATKWDVQK